MPRRAPGTPAADASATGGQPDVWVPEFPGQRPPFAPGNPWTVGPGNVLAVTHGAYSQRVVGPIADALVEAVRADPGVGYLSTPSYQPALRAWAAAEARVIALEAWIERIGMEAATDSGRGKTPPLELLRQWEASALTHRGRLGLDPLSRARLGRDVAATQVDLVAALTDMAEARRAGQEGQS